METLLDETAQRVFLLLEQCMKLDAAETLTAIRTNLLDKTDSDHIKKTIEEYRKQSLEREQLLVDPKTAKIEQERLKRFLQNNGG